MKETLHLVFCMPCCRSLYTHSLVQSSPLILNLPMNSVTDFGRKEYECLAVLALASCIYHYALSVCSHIVYVEDAWDLLFVVRRWNNVSRSSCFLPITPPPHPPPPPSPLSLFSLFCLSLSCF